MPEHRSAIVSWAQVAGTVFLGVVGLYFTRTQETQQQQNRMVQARAELLSRRDQFEMDFREKMFPVLIDKLLSRRTHPREQMAVLKLFEQNFHDIFNGRAFFDVLEEDSDQLPREQRDTILDHLASFAREIAEAEEQLVSTIPSLTEMKEGEDTSVALFSEAPAATLVHQEARNDTGHKIHTHMIHVKLKKVRRRSVDLQLAIDSGTPGARTRNFQVSYFDAPLTDNTLLPDGHRFAITLKDTRLGAQPGATLSLFEFAADYVPSGYRLSMKQAESLLIGGSLQ